MASSIANSFPCLLFFFLWLLSTAAISSCGSDLPAEKTTHLRFYFHELFGKTAFLVAGPHQNESTFEFGDIRVFDNALTAGPEISSELIGRGQGMSVEDSLGIPAFVGGIIFVFTAGEYNGSSLTLFGAATLAQKISDMPVIGGTGRFRMAWGYALDQVLSYNATYVLVQWDVYVYHYI